MDQKVTVDESRHILLDFIWIAILEVEQRYSLAGQKLAFGPKSCAPHIFAQQTLFSLQRCSSLSCALSCSVQQHILLAQFHCVRAKRIHWIKIKRLLKTTDRIYSKGLNRYHENSPSDAFHFLKLLISQAISNTSNRLIDAQPSSAATVEKKKECTVNQCKTDEIYLNWWNLSLKKNKNKSFSSRQEPIQARF